MIKQRLDKLRKLFDQHNISGYFVPTTDEYLSEYTPLYAKRLEYITGFSGSNGFAVILKHMVLFFTDARYLKQSSIQLDSNLFKIFDIGSLNKFQWSNYIDDNDIIAYDPKLFTDFYLKSFSKLKLQVHSENLIDETWSNQPAKPNSTIYDYPIKYAGESYKDKLQKCRDILEQNAANNLVITNPESICWLLNLRAHDVEFSPLLLAHAIVTKDIVYLFANQDRFDKSFIRENITILPEDQFTNIINNIDGKILFDKYQASSHTTNLIQSKDYKHIDNPCNLWKSIKNEAEIYYMQQGHIQDAVAVCELLAFIDNNDISTLTEYDLGKKLTALRKKGHNYIFDSFPTICGYQENATIIHYCAEEKSAKNIAGQGLLLIDSGGQYMGATTDITRTIVIGTPSPEHKKYYTKILKGHIALADVTFPEDKITGANLDVLARQYLWGSGDDYAHGTGHGVGSFLSVHEGPQNISPLGFKTKLAKGMVLSNEPGYYLEGEFGIRIENMMYVEKAKQQSFLKFKMLTLVPYAKNLIDISMLTENEIRYLQDYYQEIEDTIYPLLSQDTKEWCKQQKL